MTFKPGLSLETGASVILHQLIQDHMAKFAYVIRSDRVCAQAVVGEYVNGLAGAIALSIAGGHASAEEAATLVIAKLNECVNRDLRHLRSV